VHLLGQANLIAASDVLNPRGDIDRLAEVIEAIVQRDGDRRAAVNSDLEDKVAEDGLG
jgi:hypothetical protein